MVNIIKHDPFSSIFAWPRWPEDWEENFSQRGLKVRETNKDIVVEAVVAGVSTDGVEVNIEDGVLTIKAQEKEEVKDKNEFKASAYQYYYTCALSGGAWDKAEAEVKNGVLKVTIPKLEAARPRKITVKTKVG